MSKSKSRTAQPTPAEATPPEAAPVAEVRALRLTDYVAPRRFESADDMRLKEALFAALERSCSMAMTFIDEKLAEGFTLEELLQLYEVAAPLVPTAVIQSDGRVKVSLDVQIVERGDE